MTEASHTNANSAESIQTRRLCVVAFGTVAAVIVLTPLMTAIFGASPRKVSISVLRFSFLIITALSWNRAGPGLGVESGLAGSGSPIKIWFRGFWLGALPLATYLVILTMIGERVFEGVDDQPKFLWAVTKYLPLAFLIGFLEDMLFWGFLATLLGRRYGVAVVIYAVTHFLSPSKQHVWSLDEWLVGIEALGAMGNSLVAATGRPVEILGLCFVGGTLATLCRKTGNIWLAMGVHGGWYYVRTIGRKVGEDLEGAHEWLFGTDRFYDGVLGWVAILSTAVIFHLKLNPKSPNSDR